MTTLKTFAGACALALLAALPARAQTPPPPYGPPIGIENARKVMTAAEAEAAKNNWAVVISIIDSGGNIVMLHRRDDVQLSSIEIAQGKAKTALMFKRPSKVLDDAIQMHGALGYSDDMPFAQWYRGARAARIADGPDEVHDVVVARDFLLGKLNLLV